MMSKHTPREPKIISYPKKAKMSLDSVNKDAFVESICSGLIPFPTFSNKKVITNMNGKEEEKNKALRVLTCMAGRPFNSLEDSMLSIIQKIAGTITTFGYCLYEIVEQPEGFFDIYAFSPDKGYRIPKYFLQIIPISQWKKYEGKIIFLPSKKIWCVKMPDELGGERRHKKILKKLEIVQWHNEKIENQKEYIQMGELYSRKITSLWGWSLESNPSDSTHFFNAYNNATTHWAQAVFREHIINEINNLLKRLGIECNLEVKGLLDSSEILEIRNQLLDGNIDFMAARNKMNMYATG